MPQSSLCHLLCLLHCSQGAPAPPGVYFFQFGYEDEEEMKVGSD